MDMKVETYKTYKKTIQREPAEWFLGKNLKYLRAKHDVSINELSKWTNISKAYISQLENEHNVKPSIGCCMALAFFWEVAVEDLCFKSMQS